MFNIILAKDKNNGIGLDNKLPWNIKKDMEFFKNLTTSNNIFDKSVVIMGRKTMESLPNNHLPNRINIVISSTLENNKNKNYYVVSSFNESLKLAYKINSINSNNIWVIGGASIYKQAFLHPDVNKIYCTIIEESFKCDTFIELPSNLTLLNNYLVTENNLSINFSKYQVNLNAEQLYLNLLYDIIKNGDERETRNGKTLSLFNKELTFDVSEKFPLLTTKKMFWKGIVEELLFFIRGDTDTIKLSEKGVRIWEGNTNRSFLDSLQLNYNVGDMGPMYGYQWRFFNKPYHSTDNSGIDQFKNLIEDIKRDPHSRRLLMTDFNPSQVKEGVLYPCHSLILQFYVNDKKLSVKMYQRSADVFLGLPFNIASTSLLLYIVASLTDLIPHMVTISLGDCHIYKEHLEQCFEQLNRNCFEMPRLLIPKFNFIQEVEQSTLEDYELINYQSHKSIKANMIA